MDLIGKKACIISVGVGGHYAVGIDRLARSLNFVGWGGETIMWKDYPPGSAVHHGDGQYNFKVHAFKEAFRQGYEVVLWCDASLWAVQNPMPIFDYVNDKGLYFFKSGYSLAQTATDLLIDDANVTRSSLLDVPEFATGLVGINIMNPNGETFFREWEAKMNRGLFGGNRVHDPLDSLDPEFKFSRQDQSAASMVLHQMGIKTAGEDQDWLAYYGTNYNPERIIFFVQGL